ncbi:hypothetical protein C8Q76DRAFT_798073 [Earliella scabrosa]|nr:hypothetical protein C8Q76DRAFT_798073 [Earliella scabrosa]
MLPSNLREAPRILFCSTDVTAALSHEGLEGAPRARAVLYELGPAIHLLAVTMTSQEAHRVIIPILQSATDTTETSVTMEANATFPMPQVGWLEADHCLTLSGPVGDVGVADILKFTAEEDCWTLVGLVAESTKAATELKRRVKTLVRSAVSMVPGDA